MINQRMGKNQLTQKLKTKMKLDFFIKSFLTFTLPVLENKKNWLH